MDLPVLVAKWRSDQRASTTILLCSALAECGEGVRDKPADYLALVTELARVGSALFASDANVLIAAGKMLVAAEDLLDAQRVGLLAAKVAPDDPRPFRLLGEVMLRRGDADRATRALERAVDGGAEDAQTIAWLERARAYRPMQRSRGPEAVAHDLKWTLTALGGQPSGTPRSSAPPPEPVRIGSGGPRVGAGLRRSQTVVGLGAVRPPSPGISPAKHTIPGMPAVRAEAISSLPPAGELDAEGKPFSNRLFVRTASQPPSERKPGQGSTPPSTRRSGVEPAADSPRKAAVGAVAASERAATSPESAAATPGTPIAAVAEEALEEATNREAAPVAKVEAAQKASAATEATSAAPPGRVSERAAAKLPPDPAADPAPKRADKDDVEGGDAWYEGLRRRSRKSLFPGDAGRAPPAAAVSEGSSPAGAASAALAPVTAGTAVEAAPVQGAALNAAPLNAAPLTATRVEASAPASDQDVPDPPAKPTLAEVWPVAPEPAVEIVEAPSSRSRPVDDPPRPIAEIAPYATQFVTGRPRWTRKRRLLFTALAVVVIAEVVVGVVLFGRHRKTQEETQQARELAAIADAVLRRGGARAIGEAEPTLARAKRLAPTSREVALVELRERALSVLDADVATLPALEAAIEAAIEARLTAGETAFARVVAAVARGDRAAAEAIVGGGSAGPDGWFELAAGVALELEGSPEAVRRFERAVDLEPNLFSARLRLARAQLLAGDLGAARGRVAALATAFPQRVETGVLSALLRARAGGGAPTDRAPLDRAGVGELPRSLRSIAWLFVIPKAVDPTADAWRLAAAVEAADGPATAVLAGEAALEAGDAVLARKAADRALATAPDYAEATSLVARLALYSGRLDDAQKSLAALPPPIAREVRGLAAYEACDLAALVAEVDAAPGAPRSLLQARDRLRASRPYDRTKLDGLRRSDASWSDLVAVDAALDAGELAFARQVVGVWGDVKGHPTRAVRSARLARYEGRAADARALLEGAGATHSALVEAALNDADTKEGRARALAALDDRHEPERRFLHVYLRARHAGPDEGRALLAKLKDPPGSAPLSVRAIAALAAAEIADGPRVDSILNPLLKTWGKNPDVVRAGVVVGLLPKDALKKLRSP